MLSNCIFEGCEKGRRILLLASQYNLLMKRGRVYEQNPIQNFQIELQFQKLMQIEGLSSNKQESKELFPSIKHLFHSNTTVNIVGDGPNANIRSFYYLLLCHIRKQHFKRLLNEMRQRQLIEIEGDEDIAARRDRKVSFNGKGAIFLNGPQYQNYGLHKLRMFMFSKSTNLMEITDSPFQKNQNLRYNNQKLSSQQLKKLFSQFLRILLPDELSKNYKSQIRSIRSYLNENMCIGTILTMLMRHILFSKYEVQSAHSYEEEINDHTVCTTLCDAFAIDGLICKDNLYQINTWCKVYSLNYRAHKIFFIQMFNDEFEELGSKNDTQITNKIQRPQQQSKVRNKQNDQQKYQQKILQVPNVKLQIPKSQKSFSKNRSKASSSMMDADEDSQVSDDTEKIKKIPINFRAAQSLERSSFSEANSQFNSSVAKSNFKDIGRQIKATTKHSLREQISMKNSEDDDSRKKDCLSQNDCKEMAKQQKEQKNLTLKNNNLEEGINSLLGSQHKNGQKLEKVQEKACFSKKTVEYKDKYDEQHTPSDFFQKLNIFHDKNNIKLIKIGYRQDKEAPATPNIVNNNINNNIYVNFSPHADNKAYVPVINISTAKDRNSTADPSSYIKINLS